MEHLKPDLTLRISERQMRRWNAIHSDEFALHATANSENSPYRFVTLSRDEGSLGDDIAVQLANRLGWRLFDKEIVDYIAENNHVREDIVRQLDERSQGLVHEAILRFLEMPESTPFGSDEYRRSLVKTLAALATHGSAVLVGRGANFALFGSEHGLHVRITGSLEVRAQRVSEIRKIPVEKARSCLMAVDADRRSFIRHHFRREFDDFRYYDLMVNTDRLSIERAVDSILSAMIPETSLLENRVPQSSLTRQLRVE
jgi:cytidylate kinase